MTACDTTLVAVMICATLAIVFFHFAARRARLVGWTEGYSTCAEEWREAVELKAELDEVNADG